LKTCPLKEQKPEGKQKETKLIFFQRRSPCFQGYFMNLMEE